MNKDSHIQIRVSAHQKKQLVAAAHEAGKTLSAWIIERALPNHSQTFQQLTANISTKKTTAAFAALNDFLTSLNKYEFVDAVPLPPLEKLTDQQQNLVAALVEQAASLKKIKPPAWTATIQPLSKPWFATTLKSLRPYLMQVAPVAFRRRNLFVDATIGDRV